MALTFSRWIIAAIVGCALVAAIVLHVEPSPRVRGDSRLRDLESRDNLARNHLRAAADRLRILEIRDSLLASQARSGARVRIVVDAAIPAELRQPIADLVAAVDQERGVAPRFPGVMAFVLETAETVRGQATGAGWGAGVVVDYLLPANPDAPCVTLVRLGKQAQKSAVLNDATTARLLGPCAFYEAFGPAGSGIARWLAAGGWKFAQAGSWQRDIGRWIPAGDFLAATGEDRRWLELRSAASPIGVQCVAGDAAACGTALLGAGDPKTSPSWGSVISPRVSQRLYNGYNFGRSLALGPHEISYLGDMVRAIGAEKFARFWSSAEAPPAAFRAATGLDLDVWTMQWMQRAYGDQHRGPGTETSSMAVATLLAVLAGVAATYAMTRRQVAV